MNKIRLTAAALAAAIISPISSADVPVTDLSQSQPPTTTVSQTQSNNDSSAAKVGDTKNSGLASMNFDDTSHMSSQQRIKRLERMFNARSQSQIKIHQQLTDLSNQVAQLNGQIEAQQHQIKQIVQRERDLYQELDRRFAQTKKQSADQNSTGQASATGSNNGQTQAQTDNGDDAYEHAVSLVMEKHQFNQAIPAFEQFLTQYPKSTYTPNAHYWLGQLHYTQGDMKAAQAQFNVVANKYPQSNKVPESLLKLGQIAATQKDTAAAKKLYQQVIDKYSQSSAADLAKREIEKLQ